MTGNVTDPSDWTTRDLPHYYSSISIAFPFIGDSPKAILAFIIDRWQKLKFFAVESVTWGTPNLVRVKRQDDSSAKKEESFETELCKDKDAGEWFRLVAGEGDNCRDVIQCTSSVS